MGTAGVCPGKGEWDTKEAESSGRKVRELELERAPVTKLWQV